MCCSPRLHEHPFQLGLLRVDVREEILAPTHTILDGEEKPLSWLDALTALSYILSPFSPHRLILGHVSRGCDEALMEGRPGCSLPGTITS